MRKHKVVTIDAEGRDKGKSFLILEKSAFDAERWAVRALLALSKAGVEVPDAVTQVGAMGILAMGFDAFRMMDFEDAEPLLEEMLTCIHFVPDPNSKDPMTGRPVTRALMLPTAANDGDIEEVSTLLRLRGEALELHLGFSVTVALSKLADMAMKRNSSQPGSPTSQPDAAPPSPQEEPA
ncbi:MAG: hypothetical protein AB7E24_12010 [Novosphingobium sp.]